jgi:hypothetical protein
LRVQTITRAKTEFFVGHTGSFNAYLEWRGQAPFDAQKTQFLTTITDGAGEAIFLPEWFNICYNEAT